MTDDANATTSAGGPTARPAAGRRTAVIAAAAVLLLAVGAGIGFGLGKIGGGDDKPTAGASPSPSSTAGKAKNNGGGAGGKVGPVVYVSPAGAGQKSGAGWDSAASMKELASLLKKAVPGTQVWLRGDQGDYQTGKPIVITTAGTKDAPIVVKGVDATGGATAMAQLVGNRSSPWTPTGEQGKEVFQLAKGSGHIRFENLGFRNAGNGCFRLGADTSDITIQHVRATNVRRFIEDFASGNEKTATVDGLVVRDVQVHGYSRAFARMQYDSSNLLFEDVLGDSEGQDGDPFAQGVELGDTVHAVVFRRAAMNNSVDTKSGDYWNGDGFSAESKTYDITYDHTSAAGNTDGGYDIKSISATLTDVTATDNKRNYRFWGGITVKNCTGTNPRIRGGTGTQDQVHATQGAKVTMTGCTFTDTSPATIVFDVDGTASLTVDGTKVEHSAAGRLDTVVPTGTLTQQSVDVKQVS